MGQICLSVPEMHVGFFFLHTFGCQGLNKFSFTLKYFASMSAILNKTDVTLHSDIVVKSFNDKVT